MASTFKTSDPVKTAARARQAILKVKVEATAKFFD
ncbi:hypothetical protein MITS9509_00794 [Synechococcus sp. MIT S9509]|nr:hypothetical protein MITS9504_00937 [Synechococcus sp. MIT S9504]KZR92921.1 hypothetical protein MITS9509_00794 [Synechococcus sp. MIT S9509]